MRILTFFALFLLTTRAPAFERATSRGTLLSPTPEKVIRLEPKGMSRMPASVENIQASKEAENQRLDEVLKVGTYAIIQKTVDEWNDEVVKIVARYEDGRRKVQRPNGGFLYVEPNNLHTLSPETTACCSSNGTDVCNGDKVYHPQISSSIGLPEGKVLHTFENCNMVVRDGIDYIYEAAQLGKPTQCSPKKENVCVGKSGYVQGYRNGNRYTFEGKVTNVYTDGTVLVENGASLMPVDATSVRVLTESIADGSEPKRGPASVNPESPSVDYPSLEPFDTEDAPVDVEMRGTSIPIKR